MSILKPPRIRSAIATDSPRIDTERTQPRKLEPNLGDVPSEIVLSPQFGVKRPGKAFLATRGPCRGWLCRFWPAGPEHALNTYVENRGRDARRVRVAVFDPS